jgi:beta-glucosidase
MPFPPGFLWGAATSSYQIEGAVNEDGRGESIWDRFSRVPGAVERGETGDVADDHYHRYAADVDLMADLGLRAYRFSIAWARVHPEGAGRRNEAGLDFYRRLVDRLLERDIVPLATLYHWDLPQALQDRAGGWASRETAERFGEYASTVFDALGDRVTRWITLNEPWVASFLGNHVGIHAPGIRDLPTAVRASHHLMLGHGRAVEAFRAAGRPGEIGVTLDLQVSDPATDTDVDIEAARHADGHTNRRFLDPILRGSYPADMLDVDAAAGADPGHIEPGDLALISAPIDFLGMNYYFRRRVAATTDVLGFRDVPPAAGERTTEMGWPIRPDGLRDQLLRLHREYPSIPIHITENGVADTAGVGPDGRVDDPLRIEYLRGHIAAVEEAIDAGVDVRGYFAWSLMDNFEWAFGYRPRFGLVHVDFDTLERTPKASAEWYRSVIAANGTRGS